jgi:hypothetical protein
MDLVATNLRLTDEDEAALARLMRRLKLSKQQTVVRAIHEMDARTGHRDRVLAASDEMADTWAEALEELRKQ